MGHMVGLMRPGSSFTGPLNSSWTGFSPRWKSSSTPCSAKPLNRSIVCRRLATKSASRGSPPGTCAYRGEPVGDGVGERLEGPAADDVGVIGAGRHDLAAVLVAGRVVLAALVPDLHEDEVGVLAVLAVVGEELLRQLVVLQLLVDHPAAGPVDEDRRVPGDGEH